MSQTPLGTNLDVPAVEWLESMPPEMRAHVLRGIPESQVEFWMRSWRFWARPSQLAPGPNACVARGCTGHEPGRWRFWMINAGRGFGKTRAGAEWIIEQAQIATRPRMAIVGRTASDMRDIMLEGDSGILTISPPDFQPLYEPSKRRLTWPNGVRATTFTADKPDMLRGPQFDAVWCDELAAWRYEEAWTNLMFGFRRGKDPRCCITTTPKATPLIRRLLDPDRSPNVHVTVGSTYENYKNLAPPFIEEIIKPYEGTRLGQQELWAELLNDVPGALWTRGLLDKTRITHDLMKSGTVDLGYSRVVVGVDPSAGSNEEAAECGIVVAGRTGNLKTGHGYTIDDMSLRGTPTDWGRAAVGAYWGHRADAIVAETNQGGEMVEYVIKTIDPKVKVIKVWASRGKVARAEPVSALFEQRRAHHLGRFAALEDQMCTYVPGDRGISPDHMDAMVWAYTALFDLGKRDDMPSKGGFADPMKVGHRTGGGWKVD